jgi:uncharacterized membrane protein
MKKYLLLVSVFTAFLNLSQASTPQTPAEKDILSCSFTEPFFSLNFDANTGIVQYVGVENYDEATGEFVPQTLSTNGRLAPVVPAGETSEYFYAVFGSQFELKDENDKVLMALTLDMNGTDGMSDNTYPFSAIYQGFHGGCETEKYPAVNSVEIFEGLTR